jgi:hypothetical protein
MWCVLVFGLIMIVGGIRMIRTGEGLDLRHKHTGTVYGEQAVNQGKGAVALGILVIIFAVAMMVLQKS